MSSALAENISDALFPPGGRYAHHEDQGCFRMDWRMDATIVMVLIALFTGRCSAGGDGKCLHPMSGDRSRQGGRGG